jgi:hypothetical protein
MISRNSTGSKKTPMSSSGEKYYKITVGNKQVEIPLPKDVYVYLNQQILRPNTPTKKLIRKTVQTVVREAYRKGVEDAKKLIKVC